MDPQLEKYTKEMDLCKYKDALGVPGQGIHSYRIFNIAGADVAMTLCAAFLVSYAFKLSLLITVPTLFALGIFLHWLFCVKTTVHMWLFS